MARITRAEALAAGGRLWVSDSDPKIVRVYFSVKDLAPELGLEITRYASGNIRWAVLRGERISNRQALSILAGRIWLDKNGANLCGLAGYFTAEEVETVIRARIASA